MPASGALRVARRKPLRTAFTSTSPSKLEDIRALDNIYLHLVQLVPSTALPIPMTSAPPKCYGEHLSHLLEYIPPSPVYAFHRYSQRQPPLSSDLRYRIGTESCAMRYKWRDTSPFDFLDLNFDFCLVSRTKSLFHLPIREQSL